MSIKYCFNQEIHKTFNLPCDFSTLVKDIGSLFVQKLPTTYLLQYEDADGDKIAITNDQEYQTLVKQELPTALSSVKIYVTSLSPCQISDRRSTCTPKTNSEGSFEIVENEKSLELEEIRAVDHLREENLDSKVVISLQIPNQPKLEENLPENVLDNQKSFCSSVCAKSGPNESRDLVQEMSLSMDEDQSFEDAESCHKPGFNQAFQTEEENLSLSEKSPRKSPKKSKESQGKTEEKKKVVAVELSEFKPKSSSNLSKYLSRIIQNKSSEQSPDRLAAVLCSKPVNRVSEDKYREDSPERWVSFSSQPEEIQRRQGMELHGKSLFTLKQKPEAWFLCNQDRSYRYRESEDEELNCNGQSLSKISERSNNCQNSFRELMQEDFALKDEEIEERKGRYRELKIKQVSSRQASVEISFRENTDDLLQDIWFDLQCQPKTERKNSCRDGEAKKDIVFSEESVPDNGEALNISLLTASEAKRIASAIGSITRIEGVKKLRIPPESNIAQEVPVKAKVTSPVCSRWACRRSDIKFPGEEDWPFLKQPESTYNKKETCTPPEDQVHEGSFCMGCWRSPIRGVRYVCLVCDDIEYCENCEIKINHCHPLLKIKEPIGTLQDFMENLRSKLTQKSEAVFTPKGELSFKEESIYKDMDALGRSLERSLNLDNYQSPEEVRDEYKFEYKEVSTTPLMIKSNKKEWCVVYKTICLRNAGNAMWKRCHFEPVGVIPGTITEVSYVAPGDSVLITLEIHGFFAPGKYNSMWRVVHQGEFDELCEMGYINLEFEVMENRGNGFCDQGLYEKDDHEALFYGKKLGPMDFY